MTQKERIERLEGLMIEFFDMITKLTTPENSYVSAWEVEDEWKALNVGIRELKAEHGILDEEGGER